MSKTSRRRFSSDFKAKVALEALKERDTIESLCKKSIYTRTRSVNGNGSSNQKVRKSLKKGVIVPKKKTKKFSSQSFIVR